MVDLIKQEVEAREASEQVKIHAMKPPSGVTNRGPNYTASLLVSIPRFAVCIVMKLIILHHANEFQIFKNARTYYSGLADASVV